MDIMVLQQYETKLEEFCRLDIFSPYSLYNFLTQLALCEYKH